jgi:hypothetical protein
VNGSNKQASALLLFARDPGSANQILALYELLIDQISGTRPDLDSPVVSLVWRLAIERSISDIRVAASGVALGLLGDAGIAVHDWDSIRDIDAITTKLADEQVAEVVTGLSDRDDQTPQKLWLAAKALGVRTTALLDDTTVAHPMARADLDQRFCLTNGERVLPNVIAAIDDQSRNALIAAGVPADTITVIGHIHIHRFQRIAADMPDDKVRALREAWGAQDSDHVVLFASEPLREMAAEGKQRDIDELAILMELLGRIRVGDFITTNRGPDSTIVVVRPHPREDDAKFSTLPNDTKPRTLVSRDGSSAQAILAADTIVGISSMMLVEAASIGRPAHSMIDFDPAAAASPS